MIYYLLINEYLKILNFNFKKKKKIKLINKGMVMLSYSILVLQLVILLDTVK